MLEDKKVKSCKFINPGYCTLVFVIKVKDNQ